MKKIALLLICAMLLGAAGCGGAQTAQGPKEQKEEGTGQTQEQGSTGTTVPEIKNLVGYVQSADAVYPEKITATDRWEARDKINAARSASTVEQSFADAVNGFAFGTTAKLLKDDKNSCYSPLSLYFALAVCAAGATGETQREMLDALGVKDEKELCDGCCALFKRLWTDADSTQIKLTNALFIDDEFQGVRKEYAENVTDKFFASLRTIDFDDTQAAKEALSKYISDNTAGKLTYQGDPDPSVEVMILNTLYFISRWSDQFNERATQKDVFHAPTGDTECDMMYKYFMSKAYYKGDGYIRLELPFDDGSRMVFILPDEGRLADVLASGAEAFSGGEAAHAKMNLYLPKFKIRYDVDHLENFLAEELGIKKAFDGNNAESWTMSEIPP
jgi:serpin B